MKLDPRTKMTIIFCISTLAIIYNTPMTLSSLFIVTVLMLHAFQLEIKTLSFALKPLCFMLVFLFVVQCIFIRGGNELLKLGDITILTSDGLWNGSTVVLRILILVAAALLFTTFSTRDFILGLVQMRFPYELAFMVSMGVRFLPLFHEEAVNVLTAVQLRGVELKKIPLGKKTDLYRSLFFPLVYSALMKARLTSAAMETRAFRIYSQRTYMRRLKFCFTDYGIILLSLLTTLLLVGMQIGEVILAVGS